MKQTVQPNSQVPQSSAVESSSRSLHQTSADGPAPGHLAQLAATINQSSRVQAQLKLAEEMQGGAASQSHMAPAQRAPKKEKLAQKVGKPDEKKKPGQLQADSNNKKPPTQRQVNKKEKPGQMKFAGSPAVAQLEEAPPTNRTGLPDQLKAGVENLSGLSLDDVKVHYNSGKPAQLNALAYAQGTDIHVAPGQEQHLPHETWHIVQQKQGRVEPTMQMKVGVPVNDDPGLEHEADVMGSRALQRIAITDGENVPSLHEGEGHAQDCACPGCCQAKSALQGETTMAPQKSELTAIQMHPSRMVQMKPCSECGKAKGHLSSCSRHPNRRGVIAKEKKVVHEENKSWKNIQDYRPGWIKRNNITEATVKDFCKQYEHRTIRGHGSGDNSQGEQDNTTRDLNAYKSWHTDQFGIWR